MRSIQVGSFLATRNLRPGISERAIPQVPLGQIRVAGKPVGIVSLTIDRLREFWVRNVGHLDKLDAYLSEHLPRSPGFPPSLDAVLRSAMGHGRAAKRP